MAGASTRITYAEAISEALRLEMGRDPSVIYVRAADGERAVADTLERIYGPGRVLSLSEHDDSALAVAFGLALDGLHAVCELPAAALPGRGLDELVQIALNRRRGEGGTSVVARVAVDAEEESPERWLLPVPGLTVLSPASAADAKGLLASAIRDPGPLCLLEAAGLRQQVDAVPEGAHLAPIGQAEVVRSGQRLTILTHGATVRKAIELADELDADIEVVDLRTLQPLDRERIVASAKRTGKVVIAETAERSTLTADLIEAIWSDAFEFLDAPLRRVVPLNGELRRACDELLAY